MTEGIQSGENNWLLIPFYSNPELAGYQDAVNKFGEFLIKAKRSTGLNLAVVDDGCGLSLEQFKKTVDHLVSLPENRGKAFAIREGLESLLCGSNINPRFIVQYDGDGDQSYVDIPGIQTKLLHISKGDPNKPALVIGDRYSEELVVAPNPDSVAYRQSILLFFVLSTSKLFF